MRADGRISNWKTKEGKREGRGGGGVEEKVERKQKKEESVPPPSPPSWSQQSIFGVQKAMAHLGSLTHSPSPFVLDACTDPALLCFFDQSVPSHVETLSVVVVVMVVVHA